MVSNFHPNGDIVLPSLCPAPKYPKKIVLYCLDVVRVYLKATASIRKMNPYFVIRASQRTSCLKIHHCQVDKTTHLKSLHAKGYANSSTILCSIHQISGCFLSIPTSSFCCPALHGHHLVFSSYLLQVLPDGCAHFCWCSFGTLSWVCWHSFFHFIVAHPSYSLLGNVPGSVNIQPVSCVRLRWGILWNL